MVRLISADDLVDGARGTLEEHIPTVLTLLGLDQPDPVRPGWKPFRPPITWEQVPDIRAVQAANLPAGVIVPRGTAGEPQQSSRGTRATWRLEVAMFDRDADFSPTAARLTRWASVLRGALLRDRTLGGVAESTRWVSESYRPLQDQRGARTLGGCVVEIAVTAVNVVDLDDWPLVTDPAPPDLTLR